MTELIQMESRGGIDYVRLDSPDNRNALSTALIGQLIDCIVHSEGRALVIGHTGSTFCAGVDLRERARETDQARQSSLLAQLMRVLLEVRTPVICLVEGAVRGGGMGIVACADIVVAGPSASFAFSEVRVGVVPAIVGGLALRKVAAGPLTAALLSGTPLSPEDALRMGLVHAVSDDPHSNLETYCEAIRAGAPGAIAATKALVARLADSDSVDQMLRDLEAFSAERFASSEAAEGMAAFLERRRPAWATNASARQS